MMDIAAASGPHRVEYQNTLEDWTALRKSLTARQKFATRLGPFLLLETLLIACLLPGALLLVALGQPDVLLIALALAALLNLLLFFAVRWPGRPDPKILRRTALALEPQFLEIENDRGWERRDWSLIARLQRTEALFILHRDDGLVYAVPLRAFASPVAAEAFIEAAHRFHEQAKRLPREDKPAPWQEAAGPPQVAASDTLQVRYSTSDRELMELQSGAALQTVDESPPSAPRSAGASSWLLLAAVVVLMLALARMGDAPLPLGIAAFFVFLLLSVLMVFPVLRVMRFVTSRWTQPAPPVTHVLTISPAGVALWAPGVETHTAWETIEAVQANHRVIVFSAHRPAVVFLHAVPKSAFADEAQAERFAQTAARYRKAAADRAAEKELVEAPHVETGNPYQPPQSH